MNGYAPAKLTIESYSEIAISVITYMEVLVGTNDYNNQDTKDFLNTFILYELTPHIVELTIAIKKTRTPKIKLPDAIILATSQIYNIPLVTRNTKDFTPDDKNIIMPYSI
jgi:predicted nucleic acid-binding protein